MSNRGGRQPGARNKLSVESLRALVESDFDPVEFEILVAQEKLPCKVCKAKGKLMLKAFLQAIGITDTEKLDDAAKSRKPYNCPACHGTGTLPIAIKTRLQAAIKLASYQVPSLRAVEHSGTVKTMPTMVRLHKTKPEERSPIQNRMERLMHVDEVTEEIQDGDSLTTDDIEGLDQDFEDLMKFTDD